MWPGDDVGERAPWWPRDDGACPTHPAVIAFMCVRALVTAPAASYIPAYPMRMALCGAASDAAIAQCDQRPNSQMRRRGSWQATRTRGR